VPHPQLDHAERRAVGEALAPHEVLAVRRPGRAADGAVLLGRDGAGVLPFEIASPEVFDSGAIGGEGDPPAVGRETRLNVVRPAAGDPRRLTARHGEHIEVAEDRKDELRAVGVHVQRKPRRLVGRERDRVRRPVGLVDLPRGVGVGRVLRRRLVGGLGRG